MWTRSLTFTFLLLLLPARYVLAQSEEDETCMDCHEDHDMTKEVDGRTISLFINYPTFAASVHGKEGCVSCHADVDVDDLPHPDELDPVECDMCHDQESEKYDRSLHGQAASQGRSLAPTCITCHGKHDILPSSDENAPTFVMNVPELCGSCHKEGTSVSELRRLRASQRNVLEHYTESIHGEGLLKRGLIVTAVCTSCHNSHEILPHEDPRSSINRDNIAKTCTQCHREVEKVHVKVINGQLWEKRPHEVPVCVDCHKTHQFQRVFYERGFPDTYCMTCHSQDTLSKNVDGQLVSLRVDTTAIHSSVHGDIACVKCHTNVDIQRDPVCVDSGPVDCSMCHAEQVDDFAQSIHGQKRAEGDPIAPECSSCHGTHHVLSKDSTNSPTFARNIPDLCGKCHREGEKAAVAYKGEEREIIKNYTMSIHGKGLLDSGLLVTATCVDCHTAHREMPVSDSTSTVNPSNVAGTCAQCHLGVYETFKKSVHSPTVTKTDKKLPVCNDCHQSHTIERVDASDFRQGILTQCGGCHEDLTESYFDTFHGKVSKLGSLKAAKCNDCHGSHDILPPSNPNSHLSKANVVGTCKKCHDDANVRFTNYKTHADHEDKSRYPYLFYSYWAMTVLLVSVFAFFGIHTLLWFPRELKERLERRRRKGRHKGDQGHGSG